MLLDDSNREELRIEVDVSLHIQDVLHMPWRRSLNGEVSQRESDSDNGPKKYQRHASLLGLEKGGILLDHIRLGK